ncbi:MAG: hypothetical protein ACRCSO_13050 [Sphingomonas sp.]
MTALLPPSTNADYHGSLFAAWFCMVLGLGWIGPGLVHTSLPDGGAGVIAGIDLAACRHIIVAAFFWAGATQIAHGLALLLIGWRYRPLVPIMLLISLGERTALAYSGWVRDAPGAGGHHPPEHYGSLILVPLILLFLLLSLRQSRGAPQTSR